MIDYTEDGQPADGKRLVIAWDKETVFRFVEEKRHADFAQIKTLSCFAGLSDNHIRGILNEMVEEGELEIMASDYYIKRIVPYTALPEITADDLAIYAEYEKQKAEEKAKKEQQKKMTYQQILDAIKGKGAMTPSQMIENFPELNCYTTQTISPILNRMVEDGIVIKTVVQRRSYFEYK